MKTIMKFVVMPHEKFESRNVTDGEICEFSNYTDMPVYVTVDAFDGLVERQAKEIMKLNDKINELENN